ncbi:fibronectin type III domain-containing protein [Paenibacillus sp. YN15]|uniref:fibronectin type III domain-containing protein n=1 Tax=Paenibacillus sp. YN15 TaxID=1742774 RepID=UPI000DCDFAEA|nr:fibronectin type III domain-containing protein [Paenibacillus sp. YN15]RAU91545.1 hypothetical protein DQG13_29295 [Paenibacillus sp. YN15]
MKKIILAAVIMMSMVLPSVAMANTVVSSNIVENAHYAVDGNVNTMAYLGNKSSHIVIGFDPSATELKMHYRTDSASTVTYITFRDSNNQNVGGRVKYTLSSSATVSKVLTLNVPSGASRILIELDTSTNNNGFMSLYEVEATPTVTPTPTPTPTDILSGLLPTSDSTFPNSGKLTDGVDTSYNILNKGEYMRYKLDQVYDINQVYWKVNSFPYLMFYFYDSGGKNLGNTQIQNVDSYQKVSFKGVKYIEVKNFATVVTPRYVYEIKAFADLSAPTPTPTPTPTPSDGGTPTPTPSGGGGTPTVSPGDPTPTPTPTLKPPSGLRKDIKSETVILSWAKSPGAVGYKVYRDGVLIAEPTTEKYTDEGLVNGTLYKYEVAAVYEAGESVTSTVYAKPADVTDMSGISLPFNVSDMIRSAVNFLSMYGQWVLLALAVIFAPVLYGLAMKLTKKADEKTSSKGGRRKQGEDFTYVPVWKGKRDESGNRVRNWERMSKDQFIKEFGKYHSNTKSVVSAFESNRRDQMEWAKTDKVWARRYGESSHKSGREPRAVTKVKNDGPGRKKDGTLTKREQDKIRRRMQDHIQKSRRDGRR